MNICNETKTTANRIWSFLKYPLSVDLLMLYSMLPPTLVEES